jgi:Ca2+:H+ antiporter
MVVKRWRVQRNYQSLGVLNDIAKMIRIGRIYYLLLFFIPISYYFAFFTSDKTLTFITSILAIIPLARIMGYCTKEIVIQTNPTISGLISATFGNFIELIIAIIALQNGLISLVQASMIGSIIGNLLLLVGLSLLVGGLRYKHQTFNNTTVAVSSTMLIIVVAGLSIPSVYLFTNPSGINNIGILSTAVAIVMAIIYIAGLVFSLKTHRDLFDASDEIRSTEENPTITIRLSALILLITVIVVAIEAELLVAAIEEAAVVIGITQTFIGIIIIATITNIAENATAIHFALKNKLDVSLEIGLSSAIQIALFVVPILMVISEIFNYGFTLEFSLFQLVALVLAVMIINYLSADGRCNWLEGAQLISVYLIIVIAFFFIQ